MKEVVVLLVIVLLLPILSIPSSSSVEEFISFRINLIHRDSLLSPYYNASKTRSEILINAAIHSHSRMKIFHNLTTNGDENKFGTTIYAYEGDYLMDLMLGNPPVRSLAIPHTAADLIWFQCQPCDHCYSQPFPVFNPSRSNTYKSVTCDSDSCKLLRSPSCGVTNNCRYEQPYTDGSTFTAGDLAFDTISFGSFGSPEVTSLPNIILGCGHDNTFSFTTKGEGVVGLGGGPLSLVSQIGDKIGHVFSYCLYPNYIIDLPSTLTFGRAPSTDQDPVIRTPLLSKFPPTFYYVSLEGVSVQGTLPMLKPDQNKPIDMIIDTTTTFTYLQTSFYNVIETAVKKFIYDNNNDALPELHPVAPYKLCYLLQTLKITPTIRLSFVDADYGGLPLYTVHTFATVKNNMGCFMIFPTDATTSVLGNSQLTRYRVEFDLQAKEVSFVRSDCK